MKRTSIIILISIFSISLSACSSSKQEQTLNKMKTINTIDSSVIYFDLLPENDAYHTIEPE